MADGAPERIGFVDWIGPHLDRSGWLRGAHIAGPVIAAGAFGAAGNVDGAAAWLLLVAGVVVLALIAGVDVLRERYRGHLREQDNSAAAAQLIAVRDALRPIVESIADMHTLPIETRQERADNLAPRSADALAQF
jgi:hypothetical protein